MEVSLAQQQHHEFCCCTGLSQSAVFLFDAITLAVAAAWVLLLHWTIATSQSARCFSLKLVAVTLAQQKQHEFCCCTVLSQSTVFLSDTNDSHTSNSMSSTAAPDHSQSTPFFSLTLVAVTLAWHQHHEFYCLSYSQSTVFRTLWQ